jgi:hypothetical protein
MRKFIIVSLLLLVVSFALLAEDNLVGPYDSMAGAGVCKVNDTDYTNLFLSQRGTLFKIKSSDTLAVSKIKIDKTQIKADGKLFCWAAYTTLEVNGKTLAFASADDNKLCYTDNILEKSPNLKIIALVNDSALRPIRIEQVAAVNYNSHIYLFVMSADHEIYQSIFDLKKNSKVEFSLLKYNEKEVYATSLNAIVNSQNIPVIYIKQAGMDKAGSLLEYNFVTKQGKELKNINGSRILVLQDGNDRIIYYGAGLTLKNTYNKNKTFKVSSSIGSYIPVITAFYSGDKCNVAVGTDYSNVVVVNKDLIAKKEFSLTKK